MEKVRVGIIGLGRWGECHLEAFSSLPQAEVVAVCDMNQERLDNAGKKYGVKNLYLQYEDLIKRDDIDLVSVVTFEKNHLEPTLLALKSGKHVLVEKPITTRLDEARQMQAAAQESGRYVLPAHLLRFDPRYAEIYQAIHSNRVGKPVSMHMKRAREKFLFATFQRTHTVYELTIHDLDLAIWYAGSRVKSVKAYGKSLTGAPAPEVLWACLEFESGAVAILHSNWMTPDEAGIEIADSIEVIGELGTASFETSHSGLQIWNKSGRNSPDTHIHFQLFGQTVGSLREQFMYICRCLTSGETPEQISFTDAVHGVEVADAIVKSCETGQEIRL
ncbi:Gfo/Idh/MocA family protein [Paenibacillus eucommiae]|uniref:Dehydrogenase n=1 Tax=Paenibacillus eucommiae TaxID=1355755 RepID=A0ABS4IP99_9BACL|nr:Gfo/Idh/MocA family oxidoreductase [Paenibacillus eucommiae]MBP1988751.1 putative dehydrogenase [Paenibacillus eucommiae]